MKRAGSRRFRLFFCVLHERVLTDAAPRNCPGQRKSHSRAPEARRETETGKGDGILSSRRQRQAGMRNRQKAGTVLILLQDQERAAPRRSHAEEEAKTLPRRAVLRFRRENSAPLKIRATVRRCEGRESSRGPSCPLFLRESRYFFLPKRPTTAAPGRPALPGLTPPRTRAPSPKLFSQALNGVPPSFILRMIPPSPHLSTA